jgi:hypothetical protein
MFQSPHVRDGAESTATPGRTYGRRVGRVHALAPTGLARPHEADLRLDVDGPGMERAVLTGERRSRIVLTGRPLREPRHLRLGATG